MLPAFTFCTRCDGTGTIEFADCSWDPDTGDESCWDETCDTCRGKGHIIPAEPPPQPERVWQTPDPATPDDFGQWQVIQVHCHTGERRVIKSRTAESVVQFSERLAKE